MPTPVRIYAEGIADVRFLRDYIHYIAPGFNPKDTIIDTGGWTTIYAQKGAGNVMINTMKGNMDNGGTNLVIFDADNDFNRRKEEIGAWKKNNRLAFKLFLFPNNQGPGALEDLLESIIVDTNKPIFECWDKFEDCLQRWAGKKIGKALTIPAKKTKIYAYLEVLLKKTEKEKIKERERDYRHKEHWNLDAEALGPLKAFLLESIQGEKP
jgi:hypothetical protein